MIRRGAGLRAGLLGLGKPRVTAPLGISDSISGPAMSRAISPASPGAPQIRNTIAKCCKIY